MKKKITNKTTSILTFLMAFFGLITFSLGTNCSIPSCQTCDSTNTYDCNTCISSYILVGTVNRTCCASTISNCASCAINSTACFTCVDDTYCIDSATSSCALCSSKLSNCSKCLNCNTCLNCSSNQFGLDSNSLCQPCSAMTNCVQCSNATSCTLCSNTSFAVNSTAGC